MTMSRQYLGLICLSLISLAIWGRSLFATFSLASKNDEYTHILLILPVSAALIFLQRDTILQSARSNFAAGGCLLGLAALIGAWGKWKFLASSADIALSLSMLALVTWWIGSVIICLGTRVFRSALFPLLFLFWLVPLPTFLLDRIVGLLQQDSASLTSFLFATTGVPVSQHGIVLSIPGIDIEVAQECSSIRSSLMLMVATMVLAHLFLCSPWRKAAVVIAAVPLSVAKNAVRIFTLSMLGTHVDPGFLTGRLHHQGGFVFFLLALAAICAMVWLLHRTEVRSVSSQARLAAAAGTAVNH
jgi:exosortase